MALCHSCNEVIKYSYHEETIHTTCRSFLAAVRDGCYICQGLFSQAPEDWRQELRVQNENSEPSSKKRRKLEVDDSRRRLTWYKTRFDNSRYGHVWLDIQVLGLNVNASLHTADPPRNPCQILYPVAVEALPWADTSFSTSSEATFTKIKAWLGRCENTHTKCGFRRDKTDVGWRPTRLIEILPSPETGGSANSMRCRIVESKTEGTMPQNPRYITLSHRWPQDQQGFQKLTLDNLPQWKASLPLNMLRDTFRDTFVVAQKLGLSYVWIDSLCIIQDGDDYADWRKESPKMHKVYSSAQFNICASKNNQNEGLFSPRNPSRPQPLQVEFPRFEDDEEFDNDDSGHYLICNKESFETWDAMMNHTPLTSRGWVFQEQLLSRANLHFGDHEVLFECAQMRASESLGSDEDYEVSWVYYQTFFKAHLPTLAVEEVGPVSSDESSDSDYGYGDDDDEYTLWHKLLTQYTTLELTKSDDRLVALSGVAQYFKNFFSHDDCYIAGLWRSRLATEMLWQLTKASPREKWETRKKTHRHLTFSWASVEGEVENKADMYNNYDSFTALADLEPIKYRTVPEAMDATGGEGQPFAEDLFSLGPTPTIEIKLTGFLRPTILEAYGTDKWRILPGTREWTSAEWSGFKNRWGEAPCLDGETRLDFQMRLSELDALNTSGRFFFMPIGIDNMTVWLFLLEALEAGDVKDMGRFRRIGIHKSTGSDFRSLHKWRPIYMAPEESSTKLPSWRYDDRSKKHTIFVI